jgi:dCMP deaminase
MLHCVLLLYGDYKSCFDMFAGHLNEEFGFNPVRLPDFLPDDLDLEAQKERILGESLKVLQVLSRQAQQYHVVFPVYFQEQHEIFQNLVNVDLVKLNVPSLTRFRNLKSECQNSGQPLQSLQDFISVSDLIVTCSDFGHFDDLRTEFYFHFRHASEMTHVVSENERFQNVLRGHHNLKKRNYFMRLAFIVKSRSNCMKRAIGAILVKNNRILAMGYNGTPYDMKNCFEEGCQRCNNNAEQGVDLDQCYCLHAELSAILEAGLHQTTGSDIYVTAFPCHDCAKMIAQAVP